MKKRMAYPRKGGRVDGRYRVRVIEKEREKCSLEDGLIRRHPETGLLAWIRAGKNGKGTLCLHKNAE